MRQLTKTQRLTLMGLFLGITFLLAFTPLGYVRIFFMAATIVHIPVIIGSILLGPKSGAALGFIFGLTSLIKATISPGLTGFAFSPLIPIPGSDHGNVAALFVCFIPRILTGIVPWYVYGGLQKAAQKISGRLGAVSLTAAGIAGSLVNTLLVLHLIYLFFSEAYASAQNMAVDTLYIFILGTVAANGIPEAIFAGMITAVICGVALRGEYKADK